MGMTMKKSVHVLYDGGRGGFVQVFHLPLGHVLDTVGVKVSPLRRASVSLRIKVDGHTTHEIDRDCARALEKIANVKIKRGWFFLHDVRLNLRDARSSELELEFIGIDWPAKVQIVTGERC